MKSARNEETIIICDSALFTSENIQILGEMSWISRVTSTIKKAKEIIELLEFSHDLNMEIEEELIKQLRKKGYQWQTVESNYGGIPQRWLVSRGRIYSARTKSRKKKK